MHRTRYIAALAVAAGLIAPATASAQAVLMPTPTPTPTVAPKLPPVASLPRGTKSRSVPLPTVVTRTSSLIDARYVDVAFGTSNYPTADCTMRGYVAKPYGCVPDPADPDPDWCLHNYAPSPLSINVRLVGIDAWQTYSQADQCPPPYKPYDPSVPITAAVTPPEANGFRLWDGFLSSMTTFMASQDGMYEYTIYIDNALVKQGWIKVTNSNPTGRTINQYVNGKYNDEFFNRCYDGDTTIHSHNQGVLYCYVTDDPDQHIELLDSLPAPPTTPIAVPEPPLSRVICSGKLVGTPRKCSIRTGRVKLSKLRWSSWDATARATGKVRLDGGKLRTARITLSQPKDGVYTKMAIKMAHNKTRRLTLRSN